MTRLFQEFGRDRGDRPHYEMTVENFLADKYEIPVEDVRRRQARPEKLCIGDFEDRLAYAKQQAEVAEKNLPLPGNASAWREDSRLSPEAAKMARIERQEADLARRRAKAELKYWENQVKKAIAGVIVRNHNRRRPK